MASSDPDTETLLGEISRGDGQALARLLSRHRARLRRMVAVRMDGRIASRLDPSDVVQEALADAARKLPEYLRDRPLPFYPWLRRLAWDRVVQEHRRHIWSKARGVDRERSIGLPLPEDSAILLVEHLIAGESSPSQRVVQEERRQYVRVALQMLSSQNREIIVMRYLEGLSFIEIAASLELNLGAVKMRHLRALQFLRERMTDESAEEAR